MLAGYGDDPQRVTVPSILQLAITPEMHGIKGADVDNQRGRTGLPGHSAQYDLNPALPYLIPQSGVTRLKERRHEVAVVPGRQPRYSTDHGLGMKISS